MSAIPLLLIAAVAPVEAVKPKPTVTLAEIAAGLRAWRVRIETVRVSTESRYEDVRKQRPQRDERVIAGFSQLAWSASGKWRWHWWTITDSGMVRELLHAYNGRFRWDLSSPGNDLKSRMPSAKIESHTPTRELSDFSWFRAPYFCIAFHADDGRDGFLWLDQHIEKGNVKLVGAEFMGGRKLPVVEFSPLIVRFNGRGRRVFESAPPHRLTIDPDHGCLVKKHVYSDQVHLTEEFRKVSMPGSPDVWFPASGYYESSHNGQLQQRTRWHVHSVELNEKLDETLFQPKFPPGTKIEDHTPDKAFTPRPPPVEPSAKDRFQLGLAWLIGAAVAVACIWMIVRTWKQLRSRT